MYLPSGERAWKLDDHKKTMFITILFTAHLAIALVIQAAVALVILQVKKRQFGFQPLKTEESDDEDGNVVSPLIPATDDIQA